MTDARDPHSMYHASQSNPKGSGQGDVPALLRRVADMVEALGEVEVYDITFTSIATADENDIAMTVYYDRQNSPPTLTIARSEQAQAT